MFTIQQVIDGKQQLWTTLPLPLPKDLVVLDSSFNPPHVAHEQLLNLPVPGLEPSRLPRALLLSLANADKPGSTVQDYQHRLNMMQLVCEQHRIGIIVVKNAARFVDKYKVLTQNAVSDLKVYFPMGYDTLIRVFNAKYYSDYPRELNEFFCGARILWIPRLGSSGEEEIPAEFAPFVSKINVEPSDVASSTIRTDPKRYQRLLNPLVYQYIVDNGLYH